ncbi:MAG: oligoendopeptidase F, partial [Kiritimatiellae bacterium]|nr:oligoendopeptidase F [Kiritimatiellia bacterium]
HHLLAETKDAGMRAYLLNHLCDSFKGTIFRQVMFAEFERDIHAAAERGEPLVADGLCREYAALNAAYYGPELEADSGAESPIAMEWARIPHFYYDFYVYKYATSFCAALVFARRIREGRGVEEYLGMLRGGGSKDPLVAIRDAGVDLGSAEVVRDAFGEFGRTLDELEAAMGAAQA